jgi:septal ring factor EnvC (AmiA/AmiB activator)
LLWFLAFPLGAATDPAQNSAKLEELRRQVAMIQKEIAAGEESRAEATDQLAQSERAISQARLRLSEIAREQSRQQASLATLRGEQAHLDGQVRTQQALLEKLLLQHYLGGRHEPLKLALAGRDPNELPRLFHYYRHINEARNRVLRQLREQITRSRELARLAAAEVERLAALEAEARFAQTALEEQKRVRAAAVQRIAKQISARRRELVALQRDEQRLTRLAERLARLSRPAGPRGAAPSEPTSGAFGALKGRLLTPIEGELTHRFGSQRMEGGVTWKGIFLRAPMGRAVRAVTAGQVVFADWLRGFGNLLIVDHGEGYMSLYGNNEALLHRVGARVEAGEVVAQAGDTGNVGQTGLYFELRHQGRAFDPSGWLKR